MATHIGCQLIIFGQRSRTDLGNVLREVAEAGYHGVEMGLHADPAWLKDSLASLQLKLAGVHSGYGDVTQRVDDYIKFCTELGAKYVMCSGTKDHTQEGYAESAKVLDEVGARYKAAGITFCYHHHSWEFRKVNGETGWDVLVKGLDPNVVALNIDTYWALHGGFDPVEFIRTYLDRVAYLHFKDMIGGTQAFAEVGQGIINFAAVHEALKPKDIEWYTVEQDRTARTPKESIRMSRTYIKERLGL
ncbi:MAG: sugar phosphate isomerase/epimerase [Abditibacteriales bacterium]|nr:sugar phosphate isomerase/epimerase [Abditibacteriales bacterium]MDW8366455.1 sugar phosphate isomerase/epimerase [Abditibacteriales bacterium]